MIVYRFLSSKWALAALRERRLRLSLINELNDPFEFLAVHLGDKDLRQAFRAVKAAHSKTTGLLCFSAKWSNPVLWSHYAERHRGMCLGFKVRDELLERVDYAKKRITPPDGWLSAPQDAKLDIMRRILRTKFDHWRYESEYRLFARLEERDGAHYFKSFDRDLVLTRVIAGAECSVDRSEIVGAVGSDNASSVKLTKARAAYQTFEVVRNKLGFTGVSSSPLRAA